MQDTLDELQIDRDVAIEELKPLEAKYRDLTQTEDEFFDMLRVRGYIQGIDRAIYILNLNL